MEKMTDYSWLAEDVRAFIAKTESFYPADAAEMPISAQRALYDRMCAAFDRPYPPGLVTEDRTIAGVPCRIYTPAGDLAPAQAVYFHGGGFVVGGLHSHEAICAELAAAAGVRLVAVDYRLVPEHRHPAAYDDAFAVAAALPGPKVLIGDSAGGNLAAAVALHLRADIRGQVLIYPGLGGDMSAESYHRHADAPMLSRADVEFYARERLAEGGDPADPTLAPLKAQDVAHLPPAAIFVAECDPLASDGVEYAVRLAAAGVPVRCVVEPGLVHGYLRARHMAEGARASFQAIGAALRAFARA